jgi:NDP-sugar pyrophosphorylase family protein
MVSIYIEKNCSISMWTISLIERYDYKEVKCKMGATKRRTNMTKIGCIIEDNTLISGNAVTLPDIVIGSNRRIGFNITIDRNISNKKWSFTKQNLLIKNHQFEKLIWNNPNIKREDNTRVGENYDR